MYVVFEPVNVYPLMGPFPAWIFVGWSSPFGWWLCRPDKSLWVALILDEADGLAGSLLSSASCVNFFFWKLNLLLPFRCPFCWRNGGGVGGLPFFRRLKRSSGHVFALRLGGDENTVNVPFSVSAGSTAPPLSEKSSTLISGRVNGANARHVEGMVFARGRISLPSKSANSVVTCNRFVCWLLFSLDFTDISVSCFRERSCNLTGIVVLSSALPFPHNPLSAVLHTSSSGSRNISPNPLLAQELLSAAMVSDGALWLLCLSVVDWPSTVFVFALYERVEHVTVGVLTYKRTADSLSSSCLSDSSPLNNSSQQIPVSAITELRRKPQKTGVLQTARCSDISSVLTCYHFC